MKRYADEYASDRELVVFYQILSAFPQLGAALYRPALSEGFRCWLQDVFDAAPASRQTWLEALFLYCGLADGQPKTYAEVGRLLGKNAQTIRVQAARGLRYLWVTVHVRRPEEEALAVLDEAALNVNEWPTADTSGSRMFSLEGFLLSIDQDGELLDKPLTPTADDVEMPGRRNVRGDDWREPDLWKPEYAERIWPQLTEPDRVIMKGGVAVSAD
jgi:hypothetical protein